MTLQCKQSMQQGGVEVQQESMQQVSTCMQQDRQPQHGAAPLMASPQPAASQQTAASSSVKHGRRLPTLQQFLHLQREGPQDHLQYVAEANKQFAASERGSRAPALRKCVSDITFATSQGMRDEQSSLPLQQQQQQQQQQHELQKGSIRRQLTARQLLFKPDWDLLEPVKDLQQPSQQVQKEQTALNNVIVVRPLLKPSMRLAPASLVQNAAGDSSQVAPATQARPASQSKRVQAVGVEAFPDLAETPPSSPLLSRRLQSSLTPGQQVTGRNSRHGAVVHNLSELSRGDERLDSIKASYARAQQNMRSMTASLSVKSQAVAASAATALADGAVAARVQERSQAVLQRAANSDAAALASLAAADATAKAAECAAAASAAAQNLRARGLAWWARRTTS